jgi:integral membrane protein
MTTPRRVASRLVPAYIQDDGVANPTKGLAASVLRYRIMAYIVGTGLLILTFVGVPLQYGANIPQVDAIVGPIHGFLYIIYLLSAVDLSRRARFTLPQMAAMIGAGFLPFLAFIIEHRVMKRMGLLAATEEGAGDAVAGKVAENPGREARPAPSGP